MKRIACALAVMIALTGGCSPEIGEEATSPPTIEAFKVKTDFPETAIVGESVNISADVTLAGKTLKDANVDFGVVPKDSDQENYIDAELQENGSYQIDHIFTEPGTYVIAAHVYWKDLHTMEYKYIEVSPQK